MSWDDMDNCSSFSVCPSILRAAAGKCESVNFAFLDHGKLQIEARRGS